MKNFRNSDYAVNRYAKGIVYRFADKTIEISMEQYLAENPGKTENDFLELKAFSDEDYLQQDRKENAQTKRNDSLNNYENTPVNTDISILDDYIEKQDKLYSKKALILLFKSGTLTKVQERRFKKYILLGLSTRQIARSEGVAQRAVMESIQWAVKKLKKFL